MNPQSKFETKFGTKNIDEFTRLYADGKLNLNPGFQRKSVWTIADRKKLIESILQNYPVPSIFLYRRHDNGIYYDVLDGKQRLEAVLKFQGVRGIPGAKFSAKTVVPETGVEELWDWNKLRRAHQEHTISGYEFQTVEVTGELEQIIQLFVLINSTGKSLTSAEKRQAKFWTSEFLKRAAALAERKLQFFAANGLLSKSQISRMKHVELISELMASVQNGGLIDKKKALDEAVKGKAVTASKVQHLVSEVTRTLNRVQIVFPNFGETRFRNTADFYSLFMCIWSLEAQGLILTDRKRNKEAQALLVRLDAGVAGVREKLRRAKGAARDEQIYADYLLSVQSDTDSLAQRQRREQILRKLFEGLFERRDDRRLFSAEQRRMLWHSDERKRCSACNKQLTWSNFTVDHTKAHARGGRTTLRNASLMCQPCNSKFGKRTKK